MGLMAVARRWMYGTMSAAVVLQGLPYVIYEKHFQG